MNWFETKKIVVPVDFGDLSRKAVDTALEMVPGSNDIHLVHVAPDLGTMSPEVVWQDVSDEARRTIIEDNFRKIFADERYGKLNFHVVFGDPGHQIADYAQQLEVDLIVMPSRGRTGVQRLLIGSVAERVLRLAHCPVLVIKE